MHFPSPQAFQNAHPARSSWPTRIMVALCLTAMLASMGFLRAPSAHGDDVSDLQAQARSIAEQLNSLEGEVGAIGEKFNQAQVRIEQLAVETGDTRKRLTSARKVEAAKRADAARYALTAYVGGNGGEVLPMALDGRQWDIARRDGYVSVAVGDRQQIVDDLLAAQRVEDETLEKLDKAQAEQQSLTKQLADQQRQASAVMARQQALQDSVQGKLAVAVSQQQQAIQAEQQAAAQKRLTEKFGTPPGQEGEAAVPSTTPGSPAAPSVSGPSSTSPGPAGSQPTTPGSTPPPAPTTPGQPPPTAPPATSPPVIAPPVTTPPITSPPPSSGGRGQTAANAARSQLGVRYSWGGGNASGPSYGFGEGAGIRGFDCSGLTLYAWAQAGVSLYHSAQMQYDLSSKVAISQLEVGDLVFYGTSSRSISHVGIYVGGGQVVHAPNSRSLVQTGPVYLWNGYYAWVGAARPR